MLAGASGVGIDPVDRFVERARAAVTAAGLDERIEIARVVMEHIAQGGGSFDLVW